MNYKKLAAITHPDVGGCEDQFKTMHRAFSILNDEKTIEVYE